MNALRHDLRSAWRQLRARPGLAFAAVAILALAIGLNAAVFSLVNGLLFRPLPVERSHELVAVYSHSPGDFLTSSPLSSADFLDLAEESETLTQLFAYAYAPLAVEHQGAHGEESRLVLGVRATPDYFTSLGLAPALGLLFDAATVAEAGTAQVVLSHQAWQRRFAGRAQVVGSTLRVNGLPATVVGVAPEGFFGLARGAAPELWLPLEVDERHHLRGEADARWLWVMARRNEGSSLDTVRAELALKAAASRRELPPGAEELAFTAFSAESVAILPGSDARLGQASALLLALVALVLAIAAGNVAHLFLARAFDRRREIATRRALGASTGALVRQLFVESLLVAGLGGAGGLLLAALSNRALVTLRLPLPVDLALPLAVDFRVLLFTLALSCGAALVFGLLPATTAARAGIAGVLAGRGGALVGRERRLAGLLVVTQVALALLLLVELGLAARSLGNAARVSPGFDAEGLLLATFARPGIAGSEAFDDELLAHVRALPGVEAAALASHLPLSIETRFDRVAVEGREEDGEHHPRVDSALASPAYFETMGIPLIAGRPFAASDRAGSSPVAVVNESLARKLFPNGATLGRRLLVDGAAAPLEVVGVVADGKYRTLGEAPRPFLYRVLAQARGRERAESGEITTGSTTLVVRASAPAAVVLPELRRLLREQDSRVAIARLSTLRDFLALALFLPRAASLLFGLFAGLGLVLATFGLSSLMLCTVRRERRELGIRLALGATPAALERRVVARSARLAGAGIALGLGLAALSSRALSALLYGVSPFDPATFVTVSALMLVLALAVSWLPARQAARTAAAAVLRGE